MILDDLALRMQRLFPAVIVGIACSSGHTQAAPARLADDYGRVIDMGVAKAKQLGTANTWIGKKRDMTGEYLRQYWGTPCDEALLFFVPAMHAGELILTVACKRGESVELEQSVPERQRREQLQTTATAWDQFANTVTQWTVSGPVTDLAPEVEAELRGQEREFVDSFAPLLAVYRDSQWFVLPMRVGETADVPRVKRSRWQEALIDLTGADRKQLDEQEAEYRASRGRQREDMNLAIAIREHDLTRFKQAYDELKYLPKDSYSLYQRLCEALLQGQDEMVIYALRSGSPARLAKDEVTGSPASARPALIHAMFDSHHCGSCPREEQQAHALKLVDRWLDVVVTAQLDGGMDKASVKKIRQELETAVARYD